LKPRALRINYRFSKSQTNYSQAQTQAHQADGKGGAGNLRSMLRSRATALALEPVLAPKG